MLWPVVGACAANVIDDVNRQRVHIEVEPPINPARLVAVFAQIKRDHGLPQGIHTDHGPAFFGQAFNQWGTDNDVV